MDIQLSKKAFFMLVAASSRDPMGDWHLLASKQQKMKSKSSSNF
jgi:hypothetical protein